MSSNLKSHTLRKELGVLVVVEDTPGSEASRKYQNADISRPEARGITLIAGVIQGGEGQWPRNGVEPRSKAKPLPR